MIIIGEKLNSSIQSVHDAVEARDVRFIQELAKQQDEAGASYLDINVGVFIENEPELLSWLTVTASEATRLPLVFDSPDPKAVEMALSVYTGKKPLINSITLESERYDPMLELALKYKTGLIALCLDDDGMPENAEQSVQKGCRIVEELMISGIKAEDVYLDPMIAPISTSSEAGINGLKAIAELRRLHPRVHIVCGLSNISYGLPARKFINRSFLVAAMTSGLDAAIMNPLDKEMMCLMYGTRALLGQDEYCIDYLDYYRSELAGN